MSDFSKGHLGYCYPLQGTWSRHVDYSFECVVIYADAQRASRKIDEEDGGDHGEALTEEGCTQAPREHRLGQWLLNINCPRLESVL